MKLNLLTIFMITTFTLSACKTDGTTDPNINNGVIKFSILLSAGCNGIVGYADVFFDDREIARLTPGGSTDVDTSVGEHRIEGLSDTGRRWGPILRVVEFDGQSQTLTCNN